MAEAIRLKLKKRVAIVTGAGRGLGRAHALELARRGARVVVNDPGFNMRGDDVGDHEPADAVVREIIAAGGKDHNTDDKLIANLKGTPDPGNYLKLVAHKNGHFEVTNGRTSLVQKY